MFISNCLQATIEDVIGSYIFLENTKVHIKTRTKTFIRYAKENDREKRERRRERRRERERKVEGEI